MFLEFDPINVSRIGIRIQIPPGTAGEEHVFLVRRDPRSDFMIGGINSRTHTLGFGPGPIRLSQGEVQVRWCSAPCSRFNGVEDQKGLARGNTRNGNGPVPYPARSRWYLDQTPEYGPWN